MSSMRQVGLGILAAFFSTAIILGSLVLALVEGGVKLAMAPSLTEPPPIVTPRPGEPTFTPPPTSLPSATTTPSCALTPSDWIYELIYPGDLLAAFAQQYGISIETLRQNNCLPSDQLFPGALLAVPPEPIQPMDTPTPTPTATTATEKKARPTQRISSRCSGHPNGWISYRVRRGDNLFRIALSYGLSTNELVTANCLSSTTIRVGQVIYVPSYPSRTPRRSATPAVTAEPPPVETTVPPETTEPPAVTEPPVTTEPPVVTEPPVITDPPETTEPPASTVPVVPPTEPPPPDPSEPYPPPQP